MAIFSSSLNSASQLRPSQRLDVIEGGEKESDSLHLTQVSTEALFKPFRLGTLTLPNRIVMAPMTRCFSPGGVPGPDVIAYYRRRAENNVGLIITEGTWVPHEGASNDQNVPRFHGEDALAGWRQILAAVHEVGGLIMPQLWHIGLQIKPEIDGLYKEKGQLDARMVGPSGMVGGIGTPLTRRAQPMTQREIDATCDAYVTAAVSAHRMGFDGVELHGAHGYLIDQFLWDRTNLRLDDYGGAVGPRSRYAAEIVGGIRRATSRTFPIVFRFSQWKGHDYGAKLAETPQTLEAVLAPLVDAGVNLFDCSTRRFWQAEFEGSDMNLAGWTKKLTGVASMTVGSVSLNQELFATLLSGQTAEPASINRLIEMFERGDFDLVAVGRALVSDPEWVGKVRSGRLSELQPYTPKMLERLW